MKTTPLATRQQLLQEIVQLARQAIHGSLSETYRTCGNPGCRCHQGGPKHGPHLYISYRGASGKTTGYYVPKVKESKIRQGVESWAALQQHLLQISSLNKDRLLRPRPKK